MAGFLGEDQRGAAMGCGCGELAEVARCPGEERAAFRPGDIQVAGVPQPLMFLQELEDAARNITRASQQRPGRGGQVFAGDPVYRVVEQVDRA
jgi:hypothetical protein